jgi:hypothetical protein
MIRPLWIKIEYAWNRKHFKFFAMQSHSRYDFHFSMLFDKLHCMQNFIFEQLREFESMCESTLAPESPAQAGWYNEKNGRSKFSWYCPFNIEYVRLNDFSKLKVHVLYNLGSPVVWMHLGCFFSRMCQKMIRTYKFLCISYSGAVWRLVLPLFGPYIKAWKRPRPYRRP